MCGDLCGGTDRARALDMTKHRRPGTGRRETELLHCRERLHRYALWLSRDGRDLVSTEEAVSAADLAMVRAWRRYSPREGQTFVAYARPWVRGAILNQVRVVLNRRKHEGAVGLSENRGSGLDLEAEVGRRLSAHRMMERLPPDLRDLVVEHVVKGCSLAAYARARGRHRAWACRRLQRAMVTLRKAPRSVAEPVAGGLRARQV